MAGRAPHSGGLTDGADSPFGVKDVGIDPRLVTIYDPLKVHPLFKRHTAGRAYGHRILGGIVLEFVCMLASGQMVRVPSALIHRFPGAPCNDNRAARSR